jgi:uncharacterized membrane protein
MSKHRKEIRAAQNNEVARLEHTEVFDDNLLPDASEIEKLHAIDPQILPWLKARAEKEQDFRHNSFDKRVQITENHNKREHNTTRMALMIYFFLVAACLVASYLLISNDKKIAGSIFGGVGVIMALAVLITRKSNPLPKDSKQEKK